MDLTIEAIENDLLLAEQNIGRPSYDLHLTRAKIRATLMAGYAVTGTLGQTVKLEAEPQPIPPNFGWPIEDAVVIEDSAESDDQQDIFADARNERRK